MTVDVGDLSCAALVCLGGWAGSRAVHGRDRRGRRDPGGAVGAHRRVPRHRRSMMLRSRRRHRAALERSLPALAEATARELRVGTSIAAALFEGAAAAGVGLADELGEVRTATAGGAALLPSLEAWSARWDSSALDHLVAVVALGTQLGGELAPSLDAVADALRDRIEVRDEITSLTSQSRASAWLLTGLPPVAVAGLALVDTASARFLVASPLGSACLAAAVLLLATGWWWMRWLTEGAHG